MPVPVVVIAELFVRPGKEDDFARFEDQALRILGEHGGRLERAVRPSTGTPGRTPFEIHVLVLPSQAALDAYRRDPRLAGLAELRASAVEDTTLWSGPDVSVEYTA